jgi:hypothetical protein
MTADYKKYGNVLSKYEKVCQKEGYLPKVKKVEKTKKV